MQSPLPSTAGGSRPWLGVVPMGLVASVLGYPGGRLLAQLWALLPRVLGTLRAQLSLPWARGTGGRGSGQLPPVCPCRPARPVSEPRVPLRAGGLPQCLPGVQRAAGLRERLRRGGELLPALPATLLTALPPFTPGPCECQQPSPRGSHCSAALSRLREEPLAHLFPRSGATAPPAIGWPRTA